MFATYFPGNGGQSRDVPSGPRKAGDESAPDRIGARRHDDLAGNRVTNRIRCTFHACCITPSRFGLEHPRPYALLLLSPTKCCSSFSAKGEPEFSGNLPGQKKAATESESFWLRPASTKVSDSLPFRRPLKLLGRKLSC
jgi:hypothetical protein